MLKLNLQRFATDELIGTWQFNDKITANSMSFFSTITNVSFISNSQTFTSMKTESVGPMGEQVFKYGNVGVADVDLIQTDSVTWKNNAYKTITITDTSSLGSQKQDFTTWLKANATKQVSKIDDNYNNLATKDDLERYQTRLREGTNITIDENGTINASGGTIDNNVTFIKTDGTGVGLQSAQLYGTPKGESNTTIYPIAKTTDLIADDEYSPFATKTDEDKQVAMDTNGKLWYKSGGGSANGVLWEEIVSDELLGTWVFKDELNGNGEKTFNITFKSNSSTFNELRYDLYGYPSSSPKTSVSYNGNLVFSGFEGWSNQNHKTIEITDTSNLTNRDELIKFLITDKNATKQ